MLGKHMRNVALALTSLMLCSLLLVACDNNGGASVATTSSGGATTSSGDAATSSADIASTGDSANSDTAAVVKKEHITQESYSIPNVLDPQVSGQTMEWCINENIYDPLLRAYRGDFSDIRPWIAESYELDDENKDWTIKLRQGIKFHNGDELTADDVVYTLERARTKAVTGMTMTLVEAIEKIDDYTVKILNSAPSPALLVTLAVPQFGIVCKRVIEEYGEGALEAIVGTGAYKLAEWGSDNSITLEYVGDDYFMAKEYGQPDIKSITFRTILDATAATIAFDSGELDIFTRNVMYSDYQRLRDDPNVTTREFTQSVVRGISVNIKDPVLSDVRIRKGMHYAMDKESIVALVAEGEGNTNVWTKTDPRGEGGATADFVTYPYDPDKAKSVLAEAGIDEANPLNINLLSNTFNISTRTASAVQDLLRQVNINVDIQEVENAQFVSALAAGEYQTAYCQWGGEFWWSPLQYRIHINGDNYFGYENYTDARVLDLLEQGFRTWELEKRIPMYEEVLHAISDDVVGIPLYQPTTMIASTKGLQVYSDVGNLYAYAFWMRWE